MSIGDSLEFWTAMLQLRGFCVAHVRRDTAVDPARLTVVPSLPLGLCPHCQRASDLIHRQHDSEPVRDLPCGPQAIELIIRSYQFSCRHCGCFFTPAAPAAHATERFLAQAARLIRCSDIANAAAFFGVAEKTLEKWYYDYVERQRQQPAATLPIRQLGIDELRLKKRPAVCRHDRRSQQRPRGGSTRKSRKTRDSRLPGAGQGARSAVPGRGSDDRHVGWLRRGGAGGVWRRHTFAHFRLRVLDRFGRPSLC